MDISAGIQASLAGRYASALFDLTPGNAANRFFSYAAMIIPSNDAFIANGSPFAHPVFDEQGSFVGEPFFVRADRTLQLGERQRVGRRGRLVADSGHIKKEGLGTGGSLRRAVLMQRLGLGVDESL